MANIQEEVLNQTWDLFLKFLGTGTEFVIQVAQEGNAFLRQGGNFTKEFLLALINKQKELGMPTDATAQMLARENKGEKICTMMVAEEDAEELTEYFKKKEILFNIVENPTDDSKVFMYMNGDSEKVANIIGIWQAERGLVSEIDPDLFLDNYASEGVGTITGLDRADLELFRDYAKQNGLIFSSTETEEKGKFMVVYDPKDHDAVKKTMASVLWAFSGADGARLREQLVVFLRNRQKISRSFLEAEKEFYIVNGNDIKNYIHLTANDFTYYKNAKEIKSASRSDDSFVESGLRAADGMARPVVLTREEYEVFKENGELDVDTITSTVEEKAQEVPAIVAIKELQSQQDKRLARIQEKMALDDENTAGFWIYDDSIDFGAAGEYEDTEDIDDQIKADMIAARERAVRYQFQEVSATDSRSLDYIIAEAERLRKQPEGERDDREPDRQQG